MLFVDKLVEESVISKEIFEDNSYIIYKLNEDKYKPSEDLINRLEWLRQMNMENQEMSLSENHELILKTFSKFNKLLKKNFDYYYTGGFISYISTNNELKRYHGDIDIYFNEEELPLLKEVVDNSKNFTFKSNLINDSKHYYEIYYKDTKMSIGVYSFSRKNEYIILKNYHLKRNKLLVDEIMLTKEYSKIVFDNSYFNYNDTEYKMVSLNGLYNIKKSGRPKDRFDNQILEDIIDKKIDKILDKKFKKTIYTYDNKVKLSPVKTVEKMLSITNK